MKTNNRNIVLLPEEMPDKWYNIAADLGGKMLPPLHPGTLKPLDGASMSALFPDELIRQEMSGERFISIPDEVRELYSMFRPSPLYRAVNLEKMLGTPAKIYYKYEGVSRSGASIVGGMSQKLSRTTAAEFSFFLAVPTMLGATAKKCYDYYKDGFVLSHDQINVLIIGNVIAFIVALLAIKSFIGYLTKHGFKMFGYYRIVAGIVLLAIHFFIHPLTVI